MFSSGEKGWAEYGNRTRLSGLGSPCTTDVLIPHGADTRTRTGDLRITNALLYQLSHIGGLAGAKIQQKKQTTKFYFFFIKVCV